MGVGDLTTEQRRLEEARAGVPWRAWGPYLSERQWGTVREDYSDNGDAWSYFSHDQARSRAYRWGEDGLAGISDDKQRLCLALALWNERDPILKERLFGLTNSEGNHGEDVKEYYFYLDNLPTHSYQRWLYKYPQAEFPYNDLVAVNRGRSRHEQEYELAGHRHLRRGPLLRRRGGAREGRAGRHHLPHHRVQPLDAGGRTARAAHAVVPQHLVVGRRPAEAAARRERVRLSRRAGRACRPGRVLPARRAGRGPAVLRERERAGRVPQERDRRPPHPRRRHGQPREEGNQGGRAREASGPRRRAGLGAGAAHPAEPW